MNYSHDFQEQERGKNGNVEGKEISLSSFPEIKSG
jgi:hypothetical protein